MSVCGWWAQAFVAAGCFTGNYGKEDPMYPVVEARVCSVLAAGETPGALTLSRQNAVSPQRCEVCSVLCVCQRGMLQPPSLWILPFEACPVALPSHCSLSQSPDVFLCTRVLSIATMASHEA